MKKLTKLVIIGASGFARELLWTINDINKIEKIYDVIGFVDDDESLNGKIISNTPVLGSIDWYLKNLKNDVSCVIGIGDPKIRKNIARILEKNTIDFISLIHPSVIKSDSIEIGKGTVIQAGVILTVDIKLGNHVHVNVNSIIGHDSKIGDFVTINPGSHINGNVVIGESTLVGSGTITKQNISIGKNCILGAGTVVIHDVPDNKMLVGVPGKIKEKNSIF